MEFLGWSAIKKNGDKNHAAFEDRSRMLMRKGTPRLRKGLEVHLVFMPIRTS